MTTERAPRFGGGALLSFPALQDLRCYFHVLLFQHLTFLTPELRPDLHRISALQFSGGHGLAVRP